MIPLVKRIENVGQGESLGPNLNVTRRLVCISYIKYKSRNNSRKLHKRFSSIKQLMHIFYSIVYCDYE